MDIYKSKYLKYKNKYLKLKIQNGGMFNFTGVPPQDFFGMFNVTSVPPQDPDSIMVKLFINDQEIAHNLHKEDDRIFGVFNSDIIRGHTFGHYIAKQIACLQPGTATPIVYDSHNFNISLKPKEHYASKEAYKAAKKFSKCCRKANKKIKYTTVNIKITENDEIIIDKDVNFAEYLKDRHDEHHPVDVEINGRTFTFSVKRHGIRHDYQTEIYGVSYERLEFRNSERGAWVTACVQGGIACDKS